ncbi:tetraacyldisaccharide 4'-kinase [Arsenicibacter rosenii]|uniref:tetraacyldisaccharide 4'-kinase n=1 Tax=Arsenicibacter rosenii TaxID=1750698 RepID=UPI001E658341|nr:tetraacyldisaccharide 4'-kinase [Arsenicibacter rosenii]
MLSFFLRPLSVLYGFVTDVRNISYDKNWQRSQVPQQKIISVGNLTVGGTGKTPMVEYLLAYFAGRRPAGTIATLSRGYGRLTKGFRIATEADTAETIGDEPLQVYRKFGREVCITVGEKRVAALARLAVLRPAIDLVILDDAYQHRPVRPHLSVLLMDFNRPFYLDHPFPAGRLRERRHGARRADMIVVTKCPDDLPVTKQEAIVRHIRQYSRAGTPVFFAGLTYQTPNAFSEQNTGPMPPRVILVTGIAQAGPLEAYVKAQYTMLRHERFGDHHRYSRADLDRIIADLSGDVALLTTEKDQVKLAALFTEEEQQRLPLFYLPIGVKFLSGDDEFGKILDRTMN